MLLPLEINELIRLVRFHSLPASESQRDYSNSCTGIFTKLGRGFALLQGTVDLMLGMVPKTGSSYPVRFYSYEQMISK